MKITKRQLKQLIEEELAGLYEDEPELEDEPARDDAAAELGGELAGDVGAGEEMTADDEGGLDLTTMVRSIDKKLGALMRHFDVEETGEDAEDPFATGDL